MLAKLGKLPLTKLTIEKCYKINGYGLCEMAKLNGHTMQHLGNNLFINSNNNSRIGIINIFIC